MEPTETRSISDVDKKVGNLRRNKISVVSQGGVDVEMHDYMPSSTVTKVRKKKIKLKKPSLLISKEV